MVAVVVVCSHIASPSSLGVNELYFCLINRGKKHNCKLGETYLEYSRSQSLGV
jgi:hypothetical protein